MDEVAGLPECLDRLISTGNNGGVKTKEKAGHCDSHGPVGNFFMHSGYYYFLAMILEMTGIPKEELVGPPYPEPFVPDSFAAVSIFVGM